MRHHRAYVTYTTHATRRTKKEIDLMKHHLRANLWLLVLTLALCSVLYPLILWAVGQTAFPGNAQGSLIDKTGSRLIAQQFDGEEYFHPRPSAANYDASASGASNWGASNPALRK